MVKSSSFSFLRNRRRKNNDSWKYNNGKKEIRSFYIKNIKEKHKKELYEKNMLIKQLQDKVKELESLIPPKKQEFRGLDF